MQSERAILLCSSHSPSEFTQVFLRLPNDVRPWVQRPSSKPKPMTLITLSRKTYKQTFRHLPVTITLFLISYLVWVGPGENMGCTTESKIGTVVQPSSHLEQNAPASDRLFGSRPTQQTSPSLHPPVILLGFQSQSIPGGRFSNLRRRFSLLEFFFSHNDRPRYLVRNTAERHWRWSAFPTMAGGKYSSPVHHSWTPC